MAVFEVCAFVVSDTVSCSSQSSDIQKTAERMRPFLKMQKRSLDCWMNNNTIFLHLPRHMLHGLEMVVSHAMRRTPRAVHFRWQRGMQDADFDEHRADVRNFGCGQHEGREYRPYDRLGLSLSKREIERVSERA